MQFLLHISLVTSALTILVIPETVESLECYVCASHVEEVVGTRPNGTMMSEYPTCRKFVNEKMSYAGKCPEPKAGIPVCARHKLGRPNIWKLFCSSGPPDKTYPFCKYFEDTDAVMVCKCDGSHCTDLDKVFEDETNLLGKKTRSGNDVSSSSMVILNTFVMWLMVTWVL